MQKRSSPASSLWLDRSGSSSLTIATEKSSIAHWNLRSGPGQCTIDQSLFNRDPHLKLSGSQRGWCLRPRPHTRGDWWCPREGEPVDCGDSFSEGRKAAIRMFAELDVGFKRMAVCVVDERSRIIWRRVVDPRPEMLPSARQQEMHITPCVTFRTIYNQ